MWTNLDYAYEFGHHTGCSEMTHTQLVAACLENTGEAWREFVRRYHRLVGSVLVRTVRQYGDASPDLIEELINEVYVKLLSNNNRLLKEIRSVHENSVLGYLKAVAAGIAHDYFRAAHASRRGGLVEVNEANVTPAGYATPIQELETFTE